MDRTHEKALVGAVREIDRHKVGLPRARRGLRRHDVRALAPRSRPRRCFCIARTTHRRRSRSAAGSPTRSPAQRRWSSCRAAITSSSLVIPGCDHRRGRGVPHGCAPSARDRPRARDRPLHRHRRLRPSAPSPSATGAGASCSTSIMRRCGASSSASAAARSTLPATASSRRSTGRRARSGAHARSRTRRLRSALMCVQASTRASAERIGDKLSGIAVHIAAGRGDRGCRRGARIADGERPGCGFQHRVRRPRHARAEGRARRMAPLRQRMNALLRVFAGRADHVSLRRSPGPAVARDAKAGAACVVVLARGVRWRRPQSPGVKRGSGTASRFASTTALARLLTAPLLGRRLAAPRRAALGRITRRWLTAVSRPASPWQCTSTARFPPMAIPPGP